MVDMVDKPVENEQQQAVSAPVEAEKTEEKKIPQSQVNEIVGKAKQEAYEKAMRDAEMIKAAQAQQAIPQQNIGPQPAFNGNSQLNEQQIRDTLARMAYQDRQARDIMELKQKIESGKEKNPDFEKDLSLLDIGGIDLNHPSIHVLNSVDNLDEVLHDIAERFPEKFTEIMVTSERNPQAAKVALSRLSNSIKANKEAKKQAVEPAEPLNQIKPSLTGADNGSMTVSDLRKQPWLRG